MNAVKDNGIAQLQLPGLSKGLPTRSTKIHLAIGSLQAHCLPLQAQGIENCDLEGCRGALGIATA